MAWHLCALADLADGCAQGFDPGDTGRDTIFLIRRANHVVAYRDECPHHAGAAMAWRRHAYLDATGQHIACHGHGALFDIASGLCLSGPCVGSSLDPVPIEQTEDGDIWLHRR